MFVVDFYDLYFCGMHFVRILHSPSFSLHIFCEGYMKYSVKT